MTVHAAQVNGFHAEDLFRMTRLGALDDLYSTVHVYAVGAQSCSIRYTPSPRHSA